MKTREQLLQELDLHCVEINTRITEKENELKQNHKFRKKLKILENVEKVLKKESQS